jgi:catechol 2,3-dioxygenase-like lactoylglutathione lyase family enzyme
VAEVLMLHHVQVSCPNGGEDAARAFYGGVLGLPEVAKPPELAAGGGCWFRAERAGLTIELHVGVEPDFAPAGKAHPAFLVDDGDAVAADCSAAGFPVTWDGRLPGYRRFHTADGNGNRVEILQVDGSVSPPAAPSAPSVPVR